MSRAGVVLAGMAVSGLLVAGATHLSGAGLAADPAPGPRSGPQAAGAADETPALVFVSRRIGEGGSIYYPPAKDMPGVGPHSRFNAAAPGYLRVREPNGVVRTLVDGDHPTDASLHLVDVNAPDVSYDGQRIVFAGLPEGAKDAKLGSEGYAGAWRIFVINVDGSGLRQLTFDEPGRAAALSARNLPASLSAFDDGDPVWLPNGGVVFSSTRWPAFAQYSGVRTSNLYTVGDQGQDLRRITAERNGADRPAIDPLTGKIVYARWWRNHRFPVNSLETITTAQNGIVQKDGLTSNRDSASPNAEAMFRNAWHAASIRPHGDDLVMWSGLGRNDAANHVYGGGFAPDGTYFANFFPMYNMTEAGGFGGIRKLNRGAGAATAVMGVTDITGDQSRFVAPRAYGVYRLEPGQAYASEPAVLPDGRLVVSLASDVNQDYGLYLVQPDGTGATRLVDTPGTAELRAKPIVPRPLPPVLAAASGPAPAAMPPGASGFEADGTFVFDALNVYFNAPVDTPIVSAPAVGSAAKIRFFIDHQRESTGSFPQRDWPILLDEKPVSPAGAVRATQPAHLPLFEQLRAPDGTVPLTDGPFRNGSAHVAGFNFAPRGAAVRCVGCHAGHTMIRVPDDPEEAAFSNLAPGAIVTASSVRDPRGLRGVNDRQVRMGSVYDYWAAGSSMPNEWVQLTFPVPIETRGVTLYRPRPGDQARSTLEVERTTVLFCGDPACAVVLRSATTGRLSVDGVNAPGAQTGVRAVRVIVNEVSGAFFGASIAALAEVEVIARGQAH